MELLTSRLVDDTLHWSKVNMYKHVMSVCTYYPRWKNAQHTGLVVISVRMKSMNKNVEVLWNLPNLPAKNGGSGVPLPVVVQRPSTTFPLIASNDEVVNKELAALWSVNGWNLDHEGCRSNNWDLNFRLGEFYRIRWAVENDSEFFLTLKLWVSSWNLYFVIHDNINILFLSCHTVQYFVTRENTSNKFHLFLSFGHLYFVTRKNTKKF